MTHESFVSPFSSRYCSPEMLGLLSPQEKILTFRKLWIALAKAQKNQGLSISDQQIAEMETALHQIDFEKIAEYEKKFRHDVMANIHAFGDLCPNAKSIIHLGATSTYVTDNGDLILFKNALHLLSQKLAFVIDQLSKLVQKTMHDPCLAYTHYQPAQPTTIGKRMCLWLQDFLMDANHLHQIVLNLPFLGLKGATGTQSSFLLLFEKNAEKILNAEKEIAESFGFSNILPISGQTYTRKIDVQILNAFSSFAASAHKFASDFRLLSHDGEFFEPFQESQVGSSAMPYKKNPIYCERICGIARFTMSLPQNGHFTLANQWLERSLDDSSNRRIVLPEAILSVDAILNLMSYLLENPVICSQKAKENVEKNLLILSMENILMASVRKGGNRQHLHEKLRSITFKIKDLETPTKKMVDFIENDRDFGLSRSEIESFFNIDELVGRSAEQSNLFLKTVVFPYLKSFDLNKVHLPKIEI